MRRAAGRPARRSDSPAPAPEGAAGPAASGRQGTGDRAEDMTRGKITTAHRRGTAEGLTRGKTRVRTPFKLRNAQLFEVFQGYFIDKKHENYLVTAPPSGFERNSSDHSHMMRHLRA